MVRTRSGKVTKSPLCGIWNKRTRSGNVTKSPLCGVRNKLSTSGNGKVAKSRIKQSSSGVDAKLLDEDNEVPEVNNNTEGMMDYSLSQAEEKNGAHNKDNVSPGAGASMIQGIYTNTKETAASLIQGISTNSTQNTDSTIQGISTNSTETTDSTIQVISTNSTQNTASTIQGISTNSTETTDSTIQCISTNTPETTDSTIHCISTNTPETTDSTIQGISTNSTGTTPSTIQGISTNTTETTASMIQSISTNTTETAASMIQGISTNTTAITTIGGDVDSTATLPSAHHISTPDIRVSEEDDASLIQEHGSKLSEDSNSDNKREDRSTILFQIEDTNGPELDCCSVSNPHKAVFIDTSVHKNQSKISSLAITVNEDHENHNEDTETAKVFKPSKTHKKKSPFICATCFKSYFRKDQYLVHITDHTRERLRHVPPKRRHKAKTEPSEASAQPGLEKSQIFVKTTSANWVNLRDNKNLDNANSNSHAGLTGTIEKQNEEEESLIQMDNMEDNDKEEVETTITISDDESEEADPIHGKAAYESNIPELVQYFTRTSPSTTHLEPQTNAQLPGNSSPVNEETSQNALKSTNASNSIHFREIPKVNRVETVTVDLSEDDTMSATINSSDDKVPVNEKVETCKRKIARFFMYQPFRQNQIPDGESKNNIENNLEPISHDWPKVNPAKDSRRSYGKVLDRIKLLGPEISVTRRTIPVNPAKDSRRSYGEFLERVKLLGPQLSVTRRPIPASAVSTSWVQEEDVTNMKVKETVNETVNRVKRLKVCLPQTGAIPPGAKY